MRKTANGGFALIAVLVISLVVFTLVSLALAANYRFHSQNQRMLNDVQDRARGIHIEGRAERRY